MTPEESRLAAVRRALKNAGLFGGLFAVSLLVFYFPLHGEPTSQGWLVSLIGSVVIAALGVGFLVAGYRPNGTLGKLLSQWLDGNPDPR
jgi:hypothetical protein